jgi:hypothetical protein
VYVRVRNFDQIGTTMRIHPYLQRTLAALLVFLLSPAPLLCQQAATQQAGDVANIDPAATRNGATTRLKDLVYWNDHLKTDTKGRLRVGLRDGSSLSLGSESELVVVQHDPTSQQTSLQLLLGRIRERVVKLTQPNSKFETNTPHASLGVIGTDFYVEVTPDATKVIVYSGIVRVTPLNVAAAAGAQSVNVGAGQSVTVTSNGIVGTVATASQAVIQTSIANTIVTGAGTKAAVIGGSHLLRNLLIGLGAAGAGVGIGMAVSNNGNKSSGPSIPPR